jgi:hypothetical protein
MLAEAAAAARPLFIYPLPERPLGFRRPAEWVATRAGTRPRKVKGTVRPQQGLEYLCARLIAAGLVRPPRHLDQLHQGLIGKGVARYFGADLETSACNPLRDADEVALRVRSLLGFNGTAHAEQPADDPLSRTPGAAGPGPARRSQDSLNPTGAGNGEHRLGAAQPGSRDGQHVQPEE